MTRGSITQARVVTWLTADEVACLLAVQLADVLAGLTVGDLPLAIKGGVEYVDGDALWRRLDPNALGLPHGLLVAARATLAADRASVAACLGTTTN